MNTTTPPNWREDPSVELLSELVQRPSLTPDDAGCQALIAQRLSEFGFHSESMPADGVSNLWLRRGDSGPLLVFAGHTDVVPTGPEQAWRFPPFSATIAEDQLWGRGAADMKSGLAAMVVAIERALREDPQMPGSIALLITSDEEGPALAGTRHVMQQLNQRGEQIDYCIVGEPSSTEVLGDCIRVGRRGSISAELIIHGKQGHVAYPDLADNPIHRAAKFIDALTSLSLDQGNEHFPPTSLQISNIAAGTGAENVIPDNLKIQFNLRFSTEVDAEQIRTQIQALIDAHKLPHSIKWRHSGNPFLAQPGALIRSAQAVIQTLCQVTPELSTGGGTSDGRFIAPTCAEVIELGVCNATIHQVDERVRCQEVVDLTNVYQSLIHKLLYQSE